MVKNLPYSPYIPFGFGILLNFYWIFQRDSLSMGVQLCFLVLTVLLIIAGSILGALQQSGKKKKLFLQGGQWILFIYYLYILSMLLFFGELFQLHRSHQGDFQLVPFRTIGAFYHHYQNTGSIHSLNNLWGNLVILMPLGYFLPTLFPKMQKILLFLPVMLCFCLGVEILQWLSSTGVGDIDDSILNYIGLVLAFFLTKLQLFFKKALQ